ncbi:MAG TPA: hypothetical protein VF786_01920 [Terriglobales bacterium]
MRSLLLIFVLSTAAFAQNSATSNSPAPDSQSTAGHTVQSTTPADSKGTAQSAPAKDSAATKGEQSSQQKELPETPQPANYPPVEQQKQGVPRSQQQPKRILGMMPNYRAVSAGEIPPPPTAKQAFKIATQNSFDYSSFIFVGITSAMAESSNTHKQLGKGLPGFGRYYWRGLVDKTDGNYLVIWALPTVLHEDERYFAMGSEKGSVPKRIVYSLTRIFITPNYQGHNTINAAELLGRGTAQAVSLSYYPSSDRTASALLTKYGYALLRDAYTNAFREFWPDIATHVLHRHP